jgi:hypothetical protein
VHLFWLSHEEKRTWIELSMEGQPWPKLELHGRPRGAHQRGRGGGRRGGEGGAAGGCAMRGYRRGGSVHAAPLVLSASLYMKKKAGRRKEKRRERKEKKGRKKEKEEKWKKIPNMEIFRN